MSMKGRRNRKYKSANYSDNSRTFSENKRAGWGMNLYRNTQEGKICGVAAGIADYWDVANWVVRLLIVGAFIFLGSIVFWAYFAAWLLLAPRSVKDTDSMRERTAGAAKENDIDMEYDEQQQRYRPKKVFRYSAGSSERMKRARERLDAAAQRVEALESYVTSRKFKLNNEISNLT